MIITNEHLGNRFELVGAPQRVVSLLPAATETFAELHLADRIVGQSAYCHRYADVAAPVVGEYTTVDYDVIASLDPDLVLVTSGVQTQVGRRLVERGMPVYTLGLPGSIGGVFENIVTVSALMGRVAAGRDLVRDLLSRLAPLPPRRRSTYVEIWFGRHLRTIGGRSFIADIIDLAGGEGLFRDAPYGYTKPDFETVASARPQLMVALSEPEYPVDFESKIRDRQWTWDPALIVSTVKKGMNVIHDGPSIVDTIEWLRSTIDELPGRP